MNMDYIKLQDNEPTWKEIIERKKLYAGSSTKYYLNKIKKFIPDLYSQLRHTNHMRPMLKYCIKKYGNKAVVGCEVGVADGKHAFNMLYHLNTTKLYLVDIWKYYDGFFTKNRDSRTRYKNGVCDKQLSELLDSCKRRLKRFNNNVVYIRKLSHEAIDDIHDVLDYCYLDCNHQYEYVKRDIELYFPLVKVGGVFGGHDFSPCTPNVCRAVLEFADRELLKIYGSPTDWWMIKKR